MLTVRSDQDAFVPQEAVLDRYRHIRFLSQSAVSVAPRRPGARRLTRKPDATSRSVESGGPPLDADTRRFFDWVLGQVGVDAACYRDAPLARRLTACLRVLRVSSIAEAQAHLERRPDRLPLAVSTLLIGVTQFFRDPETFAYLDESVLPMLRADHAGLRVWSAGCADGAELYSVAMLLARRGVREGNTFLGTDCRADAIQQAQCGWFDSARLDGLDAQFRQSYFVPERGGGRVVECLRRGVRWHQGDALQGPPDSELPWDLILCRNLAIYLESEASARLWTVLVGSLRVGGVLVVGKAERPEGHRSLVRLHPCIFQKQR